MVIRVIAKNYNCGSNIGLYYFDDDHMLEKLNQVIEWDKSGFPFEVKEGGSPFNQEDYVENRKYLGDKPELKPGDCFYWIRQEFAIDSPTRLIVLQSETGPLAGQRFMEEVVDNEVKLIQDRGIKNVKVEDIGELKRNDSGVVLNEKGEELTGNYTPRYAIMKLWKEKFMQNRYDFGTTLKLTIESDNYLISPVLYVNKWSVYYNPEWIFDDDMAECVTMDALGYLYQAHPRVIVAADLEEEGEK